MHIYSYQHKKGFTLIELLIVIAIIGILASIIMSNLVSSRRRAVMTSYKSTMLSIRTALEMCAGTGGGSLYGGVRNPGDDICTTADTNQYPALPKECGSISYIVTPGSGYDWSFRSSAPCGGCQLSCNVDGCTTISGDCRL